MYGLFIRKKQRRKGLVLRPKRIFNGLVKVTDAITGDLRRWETQRGKPMAVMENGSLVLTRIGIQMGYKVRNKGLIKT